MKKQKIQLVMVLVILVAVMNLFLLFRAWNRREDAAKEADKIQLIDLETSQVKEIVLQIPDDGVKDDAGGNRYHLKREDQDIWLINEETGMYADDWARAKSDAVSELLASVIQLTGQNKIENVPDLAPYGLAPPSLIIGLVTDGGGTYDIEIGDLSTAASMYYARVYPSDGETNDVYLITTLVKSLYDVPADTLRATEED